MSINKQPPPNTTPTSDHAELDIAFEDAGGLSSAAYQKQASVRFGSSPVPQGFEAILSLAAMGISGAQWRGTAQFALAMLLGSLSDAETKASSPSQLLAATVDTLIEANEDQLFASLKDIDRQQLIATLDKLIDVVGEDESHFLAPLMHFIGNLIEKYEEQSTMTNWNESLDREESEVEGDASLRIPMRGLAAAYGDDEPEYTLDMLTEINPDYAGLDENGEISLRIPALGLEAAYGDDEPEYTLNMLISANPDYDEQ